MEVRNLRLIAIYCERTAAKVGDWQLHRTLLRLQAA